MNELKELNLSRKEAIEDKNWYGLDETIFKEHQHKAVLKLKAKRAKVWKYKNSTMKLRPAGGRGGFYVGWSAVVARARRTGGREHPERAAHGACGGTGATRLRWVCQSCARWVENDPPAIRSADD